MKLGKLIASLITITLIMSGCQNLNNGQVRESVNENQDQDPTRDVTYNTPEQLQQQSQQEIDNGNFGYVHYARNEGETNALDSGNIPKLDKKSLADMITRVELSMPEIHDVATLVTDQYVLIGYKTTNDDEQEAATQVKTSALSVVPNYYKIYISDAGDAQERISRFKDLNSTRENVGNWLNDMINEMKSQPQGKVMKNNTPGKEMRENLTKNPASNSGMDETERKKEGNNTQHDIEDKPEFSKDNSESAK